MEIEDYVKYREIYKKLLNSKFRSKFSLNNKDKEYIKNKGIESVEKHAYEFINLRIAPEFIINDGKQTPMKGHPVFIAQHATATCCRGCIEKWHNRITSYNVCYTKLLRDGGPWSPSGRRRSARKGRRRAAGSC